MALAQPKTQQSADRMADLVSRYVARTPASRAAYERAGGIIAAGTNRNIVNHHPYPLFIASAKGPYLTDLDGNQYLDMIGNYTSMILGNCVPEVVDSVIAQVHLGTAWAAASPGEADLGALIAA